MTRVDSPGASVISTSQRRCHLMLMLCLAEPDLTPALLSRLNGVAEDVSRQDIAEVMLEVQRYHPLAVAEDRHGALRLDGARLHQHLCLLHGLRRTQRISPDVVSHYFVPQIKQRLLQRGTRKALFDEHNLQALISYCAQRLQRHFSPRDRLFLQSYLQYVLACEGALAFSPRQVDWLIVREEYVLAQEILGCWKKHGYRPASDDDAIPLALLFSQLHIPHIDRAAGEHETRLRGAVQQLVRRFQQLSGMTFSRHDALCAQLFSHLAQALERVQFGIGIDGTLAEEIAQDCPRLLRTTRQALVAFEAHFSLRFSAAEVGLITIMFGAGLMHDSAQQEKQVLLLTGENGALEKQLERQLRELTLLPLTIRYQAIEDYQRHSAPKGISLVVTPYITTFPLYSPPLIHAELPLAEHQQRSIRTLLES